MNAVRLSICIATLNRAAFIGETLESIISQATGEMEIVVVDGASTDGTEEVVRGFETRCSRLRYVRLEKKGGVDQDYCKAVELARGEYCWLFTDDDLLKPGAVAAVFGAIRENYSLIMVNAEVRTADLGVLLKGSMINLAQNQTYQPNAEDQHRLLAGAGTYLSFIGGVVMKREVWNQRDKEKYYGSLFVHVGVIFQSPLPGDTLVMVFPWIVIRYGNALWTSRSFEIWMFKWPGLVWSFPDFPHWAKQQVEDREPWRSWQRLLMARAMGHYSLQEYTRWLEPLPQSMLRKILCRTIAAAPVAPLNLLARLYLRLIVRKVPCMTLFDLESWRK